jgi:catechol 2,3-dioxygenase-like lactoylglutathione lyase family enzyme
MRLVQVRIVTQDVPALARFYQELTGIAPEGSDEYVEFSFDGGGGLAISSKRSADLFAGRAASTGSNRSVIFDFEVPDVDLERERLEGFISEFIVEPTNQPWGNRSMIFRDPDGNLINFFTIIRDGWHGCAAPADDRES